MKNINNADPKRETKSNENATNQTDDLVNIQERGNDNEGQQINDNRGEVEKANHQNDFGGEDAEKQIITNNPEERKEIF